MDQTVKVKLAAPGARLPAYQSVGAACFDLFAAAPPFIDSTCEALINTGLVLEIPAGYGMRVYSRSGQGFKHSVSLVNSVGVIDSDYRGIVMIKLVANTVDGQRYLDNIKAGDSIAQAEIFKIEQISFEVAHTLSETERGEKGFGSTDEKGGVK